MQVVISSYIESVLSPLVLEFNFALVGSIFYDPTTLIVRKNNNNYNNWVRDRIRVINRKTLGKPTNGMT